MWILLVQLSKQDHNKNLGSASLSPSAQIRSSTFGTNSLAHAALVLYGFVAWKAGPDGLLDASLSVGLKFPPRSLPKSLMSRSKSTASPRIDSLLPIYPAYLGSRIRCQWIPLSWWPAGLGTPRESHSCFEKRLGQCRTEQFVRERHRCWCVPNTALINFSRLTYTSSLPSKGETPRLLSCS